MSPPWLFPSNTLQGSYHNSIFTEQEIPFFIALSEFKPWSEDEMVDISVLRSLMSLSLYRHVAMWSVILVVFSIQPDSAA